MGKFKIDMDKFSFAQMCNNSDGKTSGSGTSGIYIIAIGGLCFLIGSIAKIFVPGATDIISQSIMLIGIGAGLLGYRKSKDNGVANSTKDESISEPIQEQTQEESIPLNS
jgi:hypothetical protein